MNVQDLLNDFAEVHDNDGYRRADGSWMDEANECEWNMLHAALGLSHAAQREFITAWRCNDYYRGFGQLYLIGPRVIAAEYSHLAAEAGAVGIEIVTRQTMAR